MTSTLYAGIYILYTKSSIFDSSKHCTGKLVFQGDDLRRSFSYTSLFPRNRALRPIGLRLLAPARTAGGPRVTERRDGIINAERGREGRRSRTRQLGVCTDRVMRRKGKPRKGFAQECPAEYTYYSKGYLNRRAINMASVPTTSYVSETRPCWRAPCLLRKIRSLKKRVGHRASTP